MTGAFSTEVLSEKLSKLNASQQSIESLSHWCIYHRKRAKHIVKTWEKEFFVAPKERRVSFLYLANDIIQNSRKKGSEFVSEFWKVLNNALKDVKANGDESGRNAVARLVGIWEERKVFGSRVQSLREELLGNNPLPDLETHEKEKPAPSSIKIKLDGSILEKVAKAYKEVNDGLSKEEATIEECNSTRRKIEALEKEATSHVGGVRGNGTSIADELQQQQGGLFQSIEQLQAHENTRSKLVTHLREALIEQERKLEHIRSQIQIAQSQAEQVGNFAQHLVHGTVGSAPAALGFMEHGRDVNGAVQNMVPIDDGNKKPKDAAATAAEVAAKLAASSSPAAMLSSVLSSLTAEESAALGFHSQDVAHQDKRQRLDGVPEGLTYTDAQQYLISPVQHQAGFPQTSVLQQSQFIGASMGMPYPYSGAVPPPPPPLQGRPQIHVSMPQPPQQLPQAPQQPPQPSPQQMAQLAQQMPQIPQPLPQPPPLPPGCTPGTYHSLPPSMSYYPTAPAPVPR